MKEKNEETLKEDIALSNIQEYAMLSANQRVVEASHTLATARETAQELLNEVAKELGVDIASDDKWGISKDCKRLVYLGKEEKKENENVN